MNILIGNRQRRIKISKATRELVRKVIFVAGEAFNLGDEVEVSITLTNNRHIQTLNKAYRGIDSPTDVLSFALEEPTEVGGRTFANASEIQLLGDIIISVEKAIDQAEAYGHSLDREIAFLTVHGFLHLLGFDHQEERQTLEMRHQEEKILAALSLSRDGLS